MLQPLSVGHGRRRHRRRGTLLKLTVLAASLFGLAGNALAHPDDEGVLSDGSVGHDTHQHGASTGHLPATSANVTVVSKLRLRNVVPEKIADVGVHNGYAYLAAWGVVTCKNNGVHVVDIRNPEAPVEVAFVPSKEGSYPGEGVQALHIDTPKFDGDILVTNNEKCKEPAGFGGMNIYDVTKPDRPTPLAVGVGDSTGLGSNLKKSAHQIHSVFAWDAGDKAYAVMVDNEEGTDVDIVDITNPRKAKLIAEYDLDVMFPQIKQALPKNLVEIFLHDMIVKKIDGKQIMMASYWDGGYVKLDVTNPLVPLYLGDTDFTDPDPEAKESGLVVAPEGNAHQSEFTKDDKYVIGSDEDFSPYALSATSSEDGPITASQGSETRLADGQTIVGDTVFFGRGCPGDLLAEPGGPGSQIAVVERGSCTFTEKVKSVTDVGGYEAVLIFNRTGSDACNQSLGMTAEGSIPAFGVAPREQGLAIFDAQGSYDDTACLADTTATQAEIPLNVTGDALSFSSTFDGWGYVHLYKNNGDVAAADQLAKSSLTELDTYAIDEAHQQGKASGFGDLSVHEVASSHKDAKVAYLSYYSGGFRVVEVNADEELVETGGYIESNGSNLWGVEVFEDGGKEYVATSDRDNGLRIMEYTPVNAPGLGRMP